MNKYRSYTIWSVGFTKKKKKKKKGSIPALHTTGFEIALVPLDQNSQNIVLFNNSRTARPT